MAVTIEFLSSITSGQPVSISAISSPGTSLHTGIVGTTQKDEVFIYVNNTGSGSYPFILEISGVANTRSFYNVAPQDGYSLISPGFIANNGVVFKAYSPSGAGIFLVNGYVQRGP